MRILFFFFFRMLCSLIFKAVRLEIWLELNGSCTTEQKGRQAFRLTAWICKPVDFSVFFPLFFWNWNKQPPSRRVSRIHHWHVRAKDKCACSLSLSVPLPFPYAHFHPEPSFPITCHILTHLITCIQVYIILLYCWNNLLLHTYIMAVLNRSWKGRKWCIFLDQKIGL